VGVAREGVLGRVGDAVAGFEGMADEEPPDDGVAGTDSVGEGGAGGEPASRTDGGVEVGEGVADEVPPAAPVAGGSRSAPTGQA